MKVPQKTKNKATTGYINSTPGNISGKKTKTLIRKDKCTPMLIVALFTIGKIWKQPKCPTTNEWIKKMWHTYTVEYYSPIKKNENLTFATTWMDLEGSTLSEISQTEKDKYSMLSLIRRILKQTSEYNTKETNSQIQRTNEWLPVGRGKSKGQDRGRGLRGTYYIISYEDILYSTGNMANIL